MTPRLDLMTNSEINAYLLLWQSNRDLPVGERLIQQRLNSEGEHRDRTADARTDFSIEGVR